MAASTNTTNAGGVAIQNQFQLYRRASVGLALADALDELIESGHISPQLARKVVEEVCSSATFIRSGMEVEYAPLVR